MSTPTWGIQLGALDEKLGIRVREQSAQRVVAEMPVSGNTQSLGTLHGGASAALAEAVGSWAGMIHASTLGMVCVGVDLNITHHRALSDGTLTATATALHTGRRTAMYAIAIIDDRGNTIASARITNLLVPRPT